jgi:hypothetical protein
LPLKVNKKRKYRLKTARHVICFFDVCGGMDIYTLCHQKRKTVPVMTHKRHVAANGILPAL